MEINALLIFRDELKKRNFFDWLTAHISGFLPPHRYRGNLKVTESYIKFTGVDSKTEISTDLVFYRNNILEVFHGYDDVYNVFQTRGLGLTWAPVRIKLIDEEGLEKSGYFVTGYEVWGTKNGDFYNFLVKWLS